MHLYSRVPVGIFRIKTLDSRFKTQNFNKEKKAVFRFQQPCSASKRGSNGTGITIETIFLHCIAYTAVGLGLFSCSSVNNSMKDKK